MVVNPAAVVVAAIAAAATAAAQPAAAQPAAREIVTLTQLSHGVNCLVLYTGRGGQRFAVEQHACKSGHSCSHINHSCSSSGNGREGCSCSCRVMAGFTGLKCFPSSVQGCAETYCQARQPQLQQQQQQAAAAAAAPAAAAGAAIAAVSCWLKPCMQIIVTKRAHLAKECRRESSAGPSFCGLLALVVHDHGRGNRRTSQRCSGRCLED